MRGAHACDVEPSSYTSYPSVSTRAGWRPCWPGPASEDFRRLGPLSEAVTHQAGSEPSTYDAGVLVDKLTDVLCSGIRHRQDRPSHIRVLDPDRCLRDCIPHVGDAPCTHFCPADVYELVDGRDRQIQVNFGSCLCCKACVIKDPTDVVPGDGIEPIVWRASAKGRPHYQWVVAPHGPRRLRQTSPCH